jgi:hypothetical protein
MRDIAFTIGAMASHLLPCACYPPTEFAASSTNRREMNLTFGIGEKHHEGLLFGLHCCGCYRDHWRCCAEQDSGARLTEHSALPPCGSNICCNRVRSYDSRSRSMLSKSAPAQHLNRKRIVRRGKFRVTMTGLDQNQNLPRCNTNGASPQSADIAHPPDHQSLCRCFTFHLYAEFNAAWPYP